MRFIQMLGLLLLVGGLLSPAFAAEKSHRRGDRTVAAEKGKTKAKKQKKGKAGKAAAKGKKGKKAKAAKAGKKGKAKAAKRAQAKKRAHVSHMPADPHPDTTADPAGNFEISPEAQDDLPEPNTGDLSE
jgi:hypothetical protein